MILVPCRHREVIAQGWVLILGHPGRDQKVVKSTKELNVEWSGMTSLQVWLPLRTHGGRATGHGMSGMVHPTAVARIGSM